MKLLSQICSDKEKKEHRQETLDIPEERSSNSENDLSEDKFHSAESPQLPEPQQSRESQ